MSDDNGMSRRAALDNLMIAVNHMVKEGIEGEHWADYDKQFPVPVSNIDHEILWYMAVMMDFPDYFEREAPMYERYIQTLNL